MQVCFKCAFDLYAHARIKRKTQINGAIATAQKLNKNLDFMSSPANIEILVRLQAYIIANGTPNALL